MTAAEDRRRAFNDARSERVVLIHGDGVTCERVVMRRAVAERVISHDRAAGRSAYWLPVAPRRTYR